MRSSLLLVCAGAVVANMLRACAQAPQPPQPGRSFDPALVREQQRRITAYDSVVRAVNTDSAYRLWQATLTAPGQRPSREWDGIDPDRGRPARGAGAAG